MWFDPVAFTGLDQRRDDGPILCARIVTRKECVFAGHGDRTDAAFDGVVVGFDAAI